MKRARHAAAREHVDPEVAAAALPEDPPSGGVPDPVDAMAGDTCLLTAADLRRVRTAHSLVTVLRSKNVSGGRILSAIRYEVELEQLQIELVKMQRWVQDSGRRIAILFEGRDAAGKGGTIQRFVEHLNPRALRVVALPKPSAEESGQWYFQRYIRHLPNRGEIVFFDRSWYNRAVVEPVNGFCAPDDYERFMRQVPEFEQMLHEDGIDLIKFWFSISKDEQRRRFASRAKNPLKQWKLSPVDANAQKLWDQYTHYKDRMFARTHTTVSPWVIVRANAKEKARLESIRYVLSQVDYDGKQDASVPLAPDLSVVARYQRSAAHLD